MTRRRCHHRHHHRRRHRHPWRDPPRRRMWRAHAQLRWRIFVWFGVAIVAGGLAAGGLFGIVGDRVHPLVVALVGFVLWVGAGAIAWSITRPLMSIVKVTRELGAGKLDSRLELGHHRGELGVLAEALNDMAARIERQLADQRELLAAVSHELRTPLGHMRILLESARDRGADPDLIGELEREVVEVDELVGQLLAASRLDFEAIQRRRLDARELAARELERAGVAEDVLVVEGDVWCEADPTLLSRALANLIANATEHGGGVVRVRISRGDGVEIAVDDEGPGFAEGEGDRVFERFYRGDNRAGGSLGLGLSLVRRIAEAHGGRVWAENRAGGGAQVGFSINPRDRLS